MSVLVHTANLRSFDEVVPPETQTVPFTFKVFTDQDFPPRPRAMTGRLQARIPKMFGWDLVLGHDIYLWHDASLQLNCADSIQWFLDTLGDTDIAVFKHPWRQSAREEADYIQCKLLQGSRYVSNRYEGEDLIGQMRAIACQPGYVDDKLYASGAFCYRNTIPVQAALKEWWCQTSRFHSVDQLAFPLALWMHGLTVKVIDEDIYHASHLAWRRKHLHG
jgi:hypothetical protein